MLFKLTDFEYDYVTSSVVSTVTQFDFDWETIFLPRESSLDFKVEITAHLSALIELTASPERMRLTGVKTVMDWEEAHDLRRSIVYGKDIPAWQSLFRQLSSSAETVLLARHCDRIKPPIFSETGLVNIVNPLLAHPSLIPNYLTGVRAETAWGFMCDIEQFCHSALLIILAELSTKLVAFEHLANLYRHGAFPIGFHKEDFVVFVPYAIEEGVLQF